MLLSEVFSQLTHGELSQVHIGGAETVGVVPENYAAFIAHINLALTALYTRFPLKEGTLYIDRLPGLKTYVLDSKYQTGNRYSREISRYIQEVPVFQDDLFKVERVYDTDDVEQGLNDESDATSIQSPTMKTLVIPEASLVTGLRVVYRASHPKLFIDDGELDPEEVEVELPYSHLEALLLFVASRIMNPVGMSAEFHDGNNYAAKYEQACQRLENQNMRLDKVTNNDRITRNGWV